jgi:predicted membrane protein
MIMSDVVNTPRPSVRNPVTQRAHSRQVLWQITLPFSLVVLLAVFLAVLASLSQPETASRFADISLIFLIIPTMIVAFIFLAIFAASAYGVFRLLKIIPPFARSVQDFFVRIEERVRSIADASVEPVLRVRGFSAGLRALWRR